MIPLVDGAMLVEAAGIAVLVVALLSVVPLLAGALAVSLVCERLVGL